MNTRSQLCDYSGESLMHEIINLETKSDLVIRISCYEESVRQTVLKINKNDLSAIKNKYPMLCAKFCIFDYTYRYTKIRS